MITLNQFVIINKKKTLNKYNINLLYAHQKINIITIFYTMKKTLKKTKHMNVRQHPITAQG